MAELTEKTKALSEILDILEGDGTLDEKVAMIHLLFDNFSIKQEKFSDTATLMAITPMSTSDTYYVIIDSSNKNKLELSDKLVDETNLTIYRSEHRVDVKQMEGEETTSYRAFIGGPYLLGKMDNLADLINNSTEKRHVNIINEYDPKTEFLSHSYDINGTELFKPTTSQIESGNKIYAAKVERPSEEISLSTADILNTPLKDCKIIFRLVGYNNNKIVYTSNSDAWVILPVKQTTMLLINKNTNKYYIVVSVPDNGISIYEASEHDIDDSMTLEDIGTSLDFVEVKKNKLVGDSLWECAHIKQLDTTLEDLIENERE